MPLATASPLLGLTVTRERGNLGFSARLAGLKIYSECISCLGGISERTIIENNSLHWKIPRSKAARSLNPYIQIQPLMSNLLLYWKNIFVVLEKHLQAINEIHLAEGDNGILGGEGVAGTSTTSYRDTERTPQLCLRLFLSLIATTADTIPALTS